MLCVRNATWDPIPRWELPPRPPPQLLVVRAVALGMGVSQGPARALLSVYVSSSHFGGNLEMNVLDPVDGHL